MGRPRLDNVPTTVHLPKGTIERVDAVAGKNRRSKFIREAVEALLAIREKDAS